MKVIGRNVEKRLHRQKEWLSRKNEKVIAGVDERSKKWVQDLRRIYFELDYQRRAGTIGKLDESLRKYHKIIGIEVRDGIFKAVLRLVREDLLMDEDILKGIWDDYIWKMPKALKMMLRQIVSSFFDERMLPKNEVQFLGGLSLS